MTRTGYMIRYHCNNPSCECDFFRGGADEACPICGTKDVTIVETNVGE